MSGPTILVTGATGKTGSAVVQQLLSHGADVRALAHTRDARFEKLRAARVDVVSADLFDPVQVRAAMDGVQRMVYVPPWHPHMMHSAVAVATAARQAHLEAIVGLSQWLANPNHPSLATRQNWLVEQLFDMLPETIHITVNCRAAGLSPSAGRRRPKRTAVELGHCPGSQRGAAGTRTSRRTALPADRSAAAVLIRHRLGRRRSAGPHRPPDATAQLDVRQGSTHAGPESRRRHVPAEPSAVLLPGRQIGHLGNHGPHHRRARRHRITGRRLSHDGPPLHRWTACTAQCRQHGKGVVGLHPDRADATTPTRALHPHAATSTPAHSRNVRAFSDLVCRARPTPAPVGGLTSRGARTA